MRFIGRRYLSRYLQGIVFSCVVLASSQTALPYATSSGPDGDVREAIRKGSRLARRGDLVGAEGVFRKASANNPENTELKTELAYVLIKERRLREGYDLIFPIAKAEPQNSHAFAVLGMAFLAVGRIEEARKLFKNAVLLNRKEHLAWAGYGMAEFYENHIDSAVDNISEAVYRSPDEPDYIFWLAQASSRAERYGEAANDYRHFLSIAGPLDKDRRERIKGLVAFLDYLGRAKTLYVPSGQARTSVPIDLVGDRPVIKVRINGGKDELRFVLDTGSGISVMSVSNAKRLHINPIARGGSARGIGGDGKFDIVYGMLQQVDIGGVSIKNVPIYLRPFDNRLEADGYIGLSLISRFITTLDYGARTFALTSKEADKEQFANDGGLSLPLRLTSSGFLSGEVSLEGLNTPLNFIVDTGASISVISNDVASMDALAPYAHDERLQVVGAAGIAENVPTFRLPRVTFGKNTRNDILAVALDLNVINEASGFEQSGILGGNFLKNYRLTFDFRNAKVIFVPLNEPKE
jgi:Flp pilus assembly protein TadD/predicted aspartyl protease